MKTAQEMEAAVIARATEDADFRAQLLGDPKGAIEQELGISIPEAMEIRVHEERKVKPVLGGIGSIRTVLVQEHGSLTWEPCPGSPFLRKRATAPYRAQERTPCLHSKSSACTQESSRSRIRRVMN